MSFFKPIIILATITIAQFSSAQVTPADLDQAYVSEVVHNLNSASSNLNAHLLADLLKNIKSDVTLNEVSVAHVTKAKVGSIYFIEWSFASTVPDTQGTKIKAEVLLNNKTNSVEIFNFHVDRLVSTSPKPGVGMGTRGRF